MSDILENGQEVFRTDTIRTRDLNRWVRKIARLSGQPVDWCWFAGRAFVLATGDLNRVHITILELMDDHDALYRQALINLAGEDEQLRRIFLYRFACHVAHREGLPLPAYPGQ